MSQPKREALTQVVKLNDMNQLESVNDSETFAKVETDTHGKILDYNFNKGEKVKDLYQEKADGTVVAFNKQYPIPGPVFALVPANKNGQLCSDTISAPKDQDAVNVVKLRDDNRLASINENDSDETFAKVECD